MFWKLSYRIEFWYFISKFIVSYRILIFCFENYLILSKFDILFWKLSYHIECWYFVLKIIVSYRILIFFFQKYRIVSNFDNYRLKLSISYRCQNILIGYHWNHVSIPPTQTYVPPSVSPLWGGPIPHLEFWIDSPGNHYQEVRKIVKPATKTVTKKSKLWPRTKHGVIGSKAN